MTDLNQFENFVSAFIALAYLGLAAYCTAILVMRIRRRRRVAKQQIADAEKAAARGSARVSSGFMPKSPKVESVTLNLSFSYGAIDTQQMEPHPVVWDVGSWFYVVTIIEASIRAAAFLASTANAKSLSNTSDALLQTFGLADALFPLVMYLLLYLWFSTLWRSLKNLESETVDPLNVPRLMKMTGMVVAGAIAQHIVIAIALEFTKIHHVIKVLNLCYAIFTNLTLAGMFLVVGSQIHRFVGFIPVSDDRLMVQARLVYRVSHMASFGLFVRACISALQFVSQLDALLSQSWFAQGFYFFLDFCLILTLVSSVHKQKR